MSKIILLTKDKVALICDCHYDLVKDFKWCYSPLGYAVRRVGGRKASLTYMHRVVSSAAEGKIADHVNLDKLDNSCSNLRIVTRKQNNVNKGITSKNTSGYKGVSWIERRHSWQSRLGEGGRAIYNRYFKTAEEAALAYDAAAIQVHGEYAQLNLIGVK